MIELRLLHSSFSYFSVDGGLLHRILSNLTVGCGSLYSSSILNVDSLTFLLGIVDFF